MNVVVGGRWQMFVDDLVKSGRFSSASEVAEEALRLLAERETKLQALRETISASLAEEGEFTDEQVGDAIEAELAKLAEQGY